MPNNPPSFRLPLNLPPDVHPAVADALKNQDDAITDLQQAIPYLKGSIEANTTAINTGTTSGGGTETVVIVPPQPSSNVIGMVNDQTGNTAYTTVPGDYGAFIILNDASPVAVTLATATTIQTPWFAVFINLGAGDVTITPATGNINGAGSFDLATGSATSVAYDGTNFWAEPEATGGGVTQIVAGSGISITPPGGTGVVTIQATASGYSLGGAVTTGAVTLGAGAGSGATVTSVGGVDGAHIISFTTGTGCVPSGVIYMLAFTVARSGFVALAAPAGGGYSSFSSLNQIPYVNFTGTAGYHLVAGTTALADSTSYVFYVSSP